MKKLNLLLLLTLCLSGCAGLPQVPNLTIPTAAVLATAIPNGPAQATVQPAAPAAQPAAEQPAAVQPAAAQQPAPTMLVLPVVDPEKTVSLFLEGEKAKANFSLASKLFSANYAAQIKDDAGLAGIFGKDAAVIEYKVGFSAYSADYQTASLESTIYMPQPSNVRFTLVLENTEWKIDSITILTKSGDYPAAPEGVVLGFLTAYQEAPDRMSGFLTSQRRAQQPPGGSTAMLNISGDFQGLVIQSAAVNPDPPTASIIVLIQAGGKDYQRKFVLTKDATVWGIDTIESVNG